MLSITNRQGRLLEIRMASTLSMDDLADFHAAVVQKMSRFPGKLVGCTDLRAAAVFSWPEVERLIAILKHDNPRVERNVIVVGDGAVLGMQVERMIREAGAVGRRVFQEPDQAVVWLSEALDPEERKRLQGFLAEGAGARVSRVLASRLCTRLRKTLRGSATGFTSGAGHWGERRDETLLVLVETSVPGERAGGGTASAE